MSRFRARLEPVPHGGLFVVVPAEIADEAGLDHGARVRGTVNGVDYRSALMKYSGVFHMGAHKATAQKAGVIGGAHVDVTIGLDDEPLPTDTVPDDLARALSAAKATATFEAQAPSARREQVKRVLDAKRPETRTARIGKIVAALQGRKR